MSFCLVLLFLLLPLVLSDCPQKCLCTNYKMWCFKAELRDIPHGPSNRTELLEIKEDHLPALNRKMFQNKGLSSLSELTLYKTNTTSIENTTFQDLKNLTHLSITYNDLKLILPGTFRGLSKLTELNLRRNGLLTLPSHAFEGITMRKMDFSENLITELPVDCFCGMQATEVSHAQFVFSFTYDRFNEFEMDTYHRKDIEEDEIDTYHRIDLVWNDVERLEPGTFQGLFWFTLLMLTFNKMKILRTNTFQGLDNLKYLNMRYNPLSHIEEGAFNGLDHLSHLDLSETDLHTLHGYVFQGLSSLNTLHISFFLDYFASTNAKVLVINNDAFSYLKSLVYLRIGFITISYFNVDNLKYVKEIKVLNLGNTNITFHQNQTFPPLKSLTKLYLDYNKIELVPTFLFYELPALRHLNLAHNSIPDIQPNTFTEQRNLEKLVISFNKITHLKNGTFDGLGSLKDLFLNDNKITSIHVDAFSNMKSLKSLRLQSNNITHISNGTFSNLRRLENLYLDGNDMLVLQPGNLEGVHIIKVLALVAHKNTVLSDFLYDSIQGEILINNLGLRRVSAIHKGYFNKVQFKTLDLSNNNFTVLHEDVIQDAGGAFSLDLSSCNIHNISHDAFVNLRNLSQINLRKNSITYLEQGIFQELTSLEYLDVSNNKISFVHPYTFGGNSQLRSLIMRENRLFNISANFINVSSLLMLNLSSCKIDSISQSAFSGVPNLVELNLQHNELRTLDAEILRHLKYINTLLIGSNPFKCDCKLKDTWKLYRRYPNSNLQLNPHLEHISHVPKCEDSNQSWDMYFKDLDCSNIIEYIEDNIKHNITETQLFRDDIESFMFNQYIELVILGILFMTGTIGNTLLIIMFALQNEIRSANNAVIFNLAIADFLSLIFNLALSFFENRSHSWEYGLTLCKMFMFAKDLSIGVSVYSVVALCLQRYSATIQFSQQSRLCGLSDTVVIIVLTVGVWLMAVCFALPAFASATIEGRCLPVSTLYNKEYTRRTWTIQLLVYCIVPASIVLYFYIQTARQLKESVRNFPGENQANALKQNRLRSAKMALVLTAMFCVSYGPNFLLRVLVAWSIVHSRSDAMFYISFVTYFLFFCNTCFNPIALYNMSSVFRNCFRKYLLFWHNHPCNTLCVPRNRRTDDIPMQNLRKSD